MYSKEVASLIPEDFSDNSKVWIFQSNRPFQEKEVKEINEQLEQFYVQWETHGQPVKGWAQLLFGQFVVVMADETASQVSGCSTDGMTRIIKSLEKQYVVNFFDRMTITFLRNNKAEMLPFQQVQYALDKAIITKDTLIFNNIATTKKQLLESWLVPIEKSWLASKLTLPSTL